MHVVERADREDTVHVSGCCASMNITIDQLMNKSISTEDRSRTQQYSSDGFGRKHSTDMAILNTPSGVADDYIDTSVRVNSIRSTEPLKSNPK
jgi:hypothetical protein